MFFGAFTILLFIYLISPISAIDFYFKQIPPAVTTTDNIHVCGDNKGDWIVTMYYSDTSSSSQISLYYYYMQANVHSENWVPMNLDITKLKIISLCNFTSISKYEVITLYVADIAHSLNNFVVLAMFNTDSCSCILPVYISDSTGLGKWGDYPIDKGCAFDFKDQTTKRFYSASVNTSVPEPIPVPDIPPTPHKAAITDINPPEDQKVPGPFPFPQPSPGTMPPVPLIPIPNIPPPSDVPVTDPNPPPSQIPVPQPNIPSPQNIPVPAPVPIIIPPMIQPIPSPTTLVPTPSVITPINDPKSRRNSNLFAKIEGDEKGGFVCVYSWVGTTNKFFKVFYSSTINVWTQVPLPAILSSTQEFTQPIITKNSDTMFITGYENQAIATKLFILKAQLSNLNLWTATLSILNSTPVRIFSIGFNDQQNPYYCIISLRATDNAIYCSDKDVSELTSETTRIVSCDLAFGFDTKLLLNYENYFTYGYGQFLFLYKSKYQLFATTMKPVENLLRTVQIPQSNLIIDFQLFYNNISFIGLYLTQNSGKGSTLYYQTFVDYCATNTSGCQICNSGDSILDDYTCSCDDGYTLTPDGYECIMQSPCMSSNTNDCDQICNSIDTSIDEYSCDCFPGYNLNLTDNTSCYGTTSWDLLSSSGPELNSMTGNIASQLGVVYLQGINPLPAKNKGIWIYSPPSSWNYASSTNFYNRENACVFSSGLKLWLIGGNAGFNFEIWQYDVITRTYQKYQDEKLSEIPQLQSPACFIIESSKTQVDVYVQGGYTDPNSPLDTTYLISLNLTNFSVTNIKIISQNDKNPPPTLGSFFFVHSSFPDSLLLCGGNTVSNNKRAIYFLNQKIYQFDIESAEWVAVLSPSWSQYIKETDTVLISYYKDRIIILKTNTHEIYYLYYYPDHQTWTLIPLQNGNNNINQPLDPILFLPMDNNHFDTYSPDFLMLAVSSDRDQILSYTLGDYTGFEVCSMSVCKDNEMCSAIPGTVGGYNCEPNFKTDDSLIMGVFFGVLFGLILAAALMYYKLRKLDLSVLPEELRWTFHSYFKNPKKWKKREGNELYSTRAHFRTFKENSKSFARVKILFNEQLIGSKLKINYIHAIVNPLLVSQFVSFVRLTDARFKSDENIFRDMSWKRGLGSNKRERVFNHFIETAKRFRWNDELRINSGLSILAALHATSEKIAWKVADKGFVAISKLDEGFYGKGIYFTTYALYALPYIVRSKDPAYIISYVLPGDPYPIIEDVNSPDNWVGKGLKGSSISHYVVTNNKGSISTKKQIKYDELVFAQESACLPAFIVIPDKSNISELVKDFLRVLPEDLDDRDRKRETRDERIDVRDERIYNIDEVIIVDKDPEYQRYEDKKRDTKSSRNTKDSKRGTKSEKSVRESARDERKFPMDEIIIERETEYQNYHDDSSSSSSDIPENKRKFSILEVEDPQ